MNRREFLLLRKEARPREFELSCDQLYMQCLDSGVTAPSSDGSADPIDTSPWGGEPPAQFSGRSREQLFEALNHELLDVEVLKVVNSQWLVGDLRQDFDRVMEGFRARGGRVHIQ